MTQTAKFPSWAPKILCEHLQRGGYTYNPNLVELVTRLITYPEMETVWQQCRDWMDLKFDFKKLNHAAQGLHVEDQLCYAGLFEIATDTISDTNRPAVTPQKKRNESLRLVAKHAKQLSQSLDSLGMRDNILWYFPWNNVLDVFRTSILEMYEHATSEESFAEPSDMDYVLDAFVVFAREDSALCGKNKTSFSVRELLKIFADEEEMSRRLPHTVVQRAKTENKSRLFLIRSLAAHITTFHNRDPMEEREFISNFARTVLDDPEINEDVVKDALRGFKLPTYVDFRNKAKK